MGGWVTFPLSQWVTFALSFAWVKIEYPEDDWENVLKTCRLEKAEDLQNERRKRKQELELIDCLQFCDKCDLLVSREDWRSALGLGSKGETTTWLKSSEKLRDTLAHSHYDLVQGTSWEDLLDLVEWMEKVIQASDRCVEKRAQQGAQNGVGELW